MANWRLSPHPLPGPDRGGHPIVHIQPIPRLVFFPADRIRNERKKGDSRDFWLGTIYVVVAGRTTVDHFTACGGPEHVEDSADRGHTIGKTPPGHYTLGPRHHHVTPNWPNSSIPWGASIRRAANGEVEFDDGSGWKPATGDGAPMNKAIVQSYILERKPVPPPETIRRDAREWFLIDGTDETGPVVTTWERNDFGKWAFNLRRGGKGTPYYIHTTPEDEFATTNGDEFSLNQSHGCIHIRPKDRDTMMEKGYLAAGIDIEVKGYDAKGPP
jgi:hypothetical protein